MQTTKIFGTWGEIAAGRVLEAKGYRILARNYRTFEGEVDIVCQFEGAVVFIEVKTRRSARFGGGEESVGQSKLLKLAKCGLHYLADQTADASTSWKIEVVIIEALGGHFFRLKHYQNVPWEADETLLDDS